MDKPQLGFFAPIIEPGVHSKSIPCFYFFTKKSLSEQTNRDFCILSIVLSYFFLVLPNLEDSSGNGWISAAVQQSVLHITAYTVF